MSKKIAVAGMLPFAVFAQQTPSSSVDETLVVTASRFEQPISTVLAPISVVDREEIELMQAKSLVDVLKRLPGIEIGQNGGRGQLASIFLRGTESDHVLVLVDGVRVPRAMLGSIDFNMLPVNTIERVELIRGSGATVYGSDAIGGVINIITTSDSDSGYLSIGAGNREYQQLNAGVTSRINDAVLIQANAGYESTEGYNVKPSATNEGDKHGFDGKNASIRLGFSPSAQWQGNLSGRWYQNEVGYDKWGTKAFLFVENNSIGADSTYKGDRTSVTLRLNLSQQENYDYAPGEVKSDANLTSDIRQLTGGFSARYLASSNLTLTGGLDLRAEEYRAGSFIQSSIIEDNPRRNIAAYGIGAWQVAPSFLIEASLRRDENEQFGGNTTGLVSAGWDFVSGYRVTASAGTAFKAPGFDTLYGYGGNPDLKPEESKNFEIGFEGNTAGVHWTVSRYLNQIDNLITCAAAPTPSNPWNCNNENIEEASIDGVEFTADVNVGNLNNYFVVEFKDPQDKTRDEVLARRAKRVFKWQTAYWLGDFQFGSSYLYQSERLNFSGGDMLGSYSVWDFTAQYDFSADFSLRARLANAFDKEYETAGGYPAQGRSYYLNLDYRF
uniref:TonB-dependent receptor domain-containing protein n=1 Tax=Thaumasiovibrio occultus TaxID=1891184 RepID=UPI000B35AB89|nr:TonB-dependent receptor [Thaumasiovibrio occultus]